MSHTQHAPTQTTSRHKTLHLTTRNTPHFIKLVHGSQTKDIVIVIIDKFCTHTTHFSCFHCVPRAAPMMMFLVAARKTHLNRCGGGGGKHCREEGRAGRKRKPIFFLSFASRIRLCDWVCILAILWVCAVCEELDSKHLSLERFSSFIRAANTKHFCARRSFGWREHIFSVDSVVVASMAI